MVPQRPVAGFAPIPPDLNLAALVEETPNFEYVTRVSCEMIEQQSMEAFEKLVLLHVIIGGKPLVIDGFQHRLDQRTFTSQWLQDNCGSKFEQARNLSKQSNLPLSIGHYLNNMSKLTNQWNLQNYKELDRQRIYLKDIDCPKLWHEKLEEQVPSSIFYLSNSTGDVGGPGSLNAHQKGIARCGDLMSCLPPEMRAENLMCYIGHEGTYTPAHREMCASLGQNLMVETSGLNDDEGKPAKPGSSIWFMTETNDRHLVSEYWLSTLGHDIEVEKHFAQVAAWKNAPFTTYIVEQKVGDFILIPPLAPHQVWNRGTRTMKVAWNRTTVETLEMALHEALPRARMVCRDEQYKNKAIVYFTLHKYSDLLKQADLQMYLARNIKISDGLKYSTKIRQLQKDFKRLFVLYTEILLSELLSPVSPSEKRGQYLPFESFITCSYCRCNIFNRFLTCTTCIEILPNGEEDTYDICMDCFAMGRSCSCISSYKWVEQFPWQDLIQKHELWRNQIIKLEGGASDKSPQSLQTERKNLKKKTLAQVCQEQLKLRPWSDPQNPLPVLTMEQKRGISRTPTTKKGGGGGDENGHPKKRAKRKDFMDKNYLVEHVSLYPEEKWKLATCSKCDRSYSYGSLWRMFDLMPLMVMEDPKWQCPYCLMICSCGSCRKRGAMTPYEPKGTVLGHDTKAVADGRSMEHLVDFSHSNIRWITAVGDDDPRESRRLNRRIEEAEIAKSQDPTLDDNYIDAAGDGLFVDNGAASTEPEIPIDPMLDPTLTRGVTLLASGHIVSINERHPAKSISSAQRNGNRPATDRLPDSDNSTQKNSSSLYASRTSLPSVIGNRSDSLIGIDHTAVFVSNGITYEYPDPTDSQSIPTNYASQQHDRPGQMQKHVDSSKRKPAEHNLLQSDGAPQQSATSTGPEIESKMSQTQLQQSLQKAKDNNKYTIAKAVLTGKTLLVTLQLPSYKLATVSRSHPIFRKTHLQSKPEELLQSDLRSNMLGQLVDGSMKRKARTEEPNDTEFRINQPRSRSSTTGVVAAKDLRGSRTSYVGADDASEDDDTIMENLESTSNRRPQGSRPLPKDKEVANEDQKAKMKDNVSCADDGQESASSIDKSSSEDENPPAVKKASKLLPVPPSMFDRKRRGRKKIKVASVKTAVVNGQPNPGLPSKPHALTEALLIRVTQKRGQDD